ncbi:ABC1 kinase family protein [Actinomarinicola tropica]|uniref:AarF/ABC1/UbiB kinase family protein n=1 Tax=Actinomarinicola tropica TaxID=2789776 RepID=A0A5Q2RJY7_9ACTN|nr:AarF/ABC1/UbiB kinase family protein [Actinomarinicola tropica]QGG96143.1 AarF/ABC1/UbiB kinase family protein [Actinomarinicola tropica]
MGRRRAALGPAAVVAALVAAVAVWRVRSRDAAVHRRTRLARNASLARVGGTTAAGYAAHRARRVFAAAERREELDRSFELRTAEQVVATLGNLKGALMKVGQIASYLDQGLPEHVRTALAQLQADAPPMSEELVESALRAELGAGPAELFAEWDPTPIAAASIGQVHRAITRDGRPVAVKVQYPGVDDAIRNDLANADAVFGAMTLLYPGLDPEPIVRELRERIEEELDYRMEAAHQQRFADHYRGHPTIHVPDVLPELSTGRVLTSELSDGVRFDEMLSWSTEERNLAAETIYRYAFGSIYRLGVFNGDPHPGNYLFAPGGRVTFLDYGLVKRFTESDLDGFEQLIQAVVVDPDPGRFRAVVDRLGIVPAAAPISDADVFEYFTHFYEFVRLDGPSTIDDAYASLIVRHMFDATGPYGHVMRAINVPPSFVVIQRINLGLYAIFGQIGATANWRRIAEELWRFTDGPPSTPMGEAIAEWERRRGPTALGTFGPVEDRSVAGD